MLKLLLSCSPILPFMGSENIALFPLLAIWPTLMCLGIFTTQEGIFPRKLRPQRGFEEIVRSRRLVRGTAQQLGWAQKMASAADHQSFFTYSPSIGNMSKLRSQTYVVPNVYVVGHTDRHKGSEVT